MSDLPPGWVQTTFGEIADTSLGKMLDRRKSQGNNLVPYLRNSNVQWEHIDLNDVLTMDIPTGEREFFGLRPEDLLVCEGGEIGRCAIWAGGSGYMAFQKALHRVRPYGGIAAKFVLYLLEYLNATGILSDFSTGSTIKHLPQERLRRLPVNLPPLAEQQRIVATLEGHLSRVSLGDQNLRQARLRSAALRRSLLGAAVSGRLVPQGSSVAEEWLSKVVSARPAFPKQYKPSVLPAKVPGYELPTGWGITSLGAISYAFGYGTSTRCEFGAAGDPVLRIPNIQHGEIVLDNLKNAVDSSIDLSSLHVDHGDMLFVRTNGSRDLIGRAGVVRKSLKVAFASYLIRFRLIPDGIPPDWVLLVISSPLWRAYLEHQASSSAGQYNLNSRILARIPIPVPPPDEISLILSEARRYEEVQRAFDSDCETGMQRSKRLRQSLLTEAFTGRLVSQDPADEPGLMLLERIRGEWATRSWARRGRGTATRVPQEEMLL